MELLENPKFILGVIAGLIFSFFFWHFMREQEANNMISFAHASKERVNKMLGSVRRGEKLDLSCYCKQPRFSKVKRSVGYLAWRDLALWLACVYDEYAYRDSPIDEYFSLARMIFGKSCAYAKLEALNEILNYSTAYILPGWSNQEKKKEICKKNLFKMVFMIIDSYSDEVYESDRTDNKQ